MALDAAEACRPEKLDVPVGGDGDKDAFEGEGFVRARYNALAALDGDVRRGQAHPDRLQSVQNSPSPRAPLLESSFDSVRSSPLGIFGVGNNPPEHRDYQQ